MTENKEPKGGIPARFTHIQRNLKKSWNNFVKWWTITKILGFVSLLLGVSGLLVGYIPPLANKGVEDIRQRISPTLFGIGVTVLLIGTANEQLATREEKKRLISQMGSQDHGFALEAVRLLRARGWLYDGSLRNASLMEANLDGADMDRANLSGASLNLANLSGARLTAAGLIMAKLIKAQLSGANLIGSMLTGADLSGANLVIANLSGADLISVNLAGANLREATLSEADLSGANLCRAHLNRANLVGARLSGAKYNSKTIWPDGFDPVAAGCVKVQEDKPEGSL